MKTTLLAATAAAALFAFGLSHAMAGGLGSGWQADGASTNGTGTYTSAGTTTSSNRPNRISRGDGKEKVSKAIKFASDAQRAQIAGDLKSVEGDMDEVRLKVLADPRSSNKDAANALIGLWKDVTSADRNRLHNTTRSGRYTKYGTGNPTSMTGSELNTAVGWNNVMLDNEWTGRYSAERQRRANLGMGNINDGSSSGINSGSTGNYDPDGYGTCSSCYDHR